MAGVPITIDDLCNGIYRFTYRTTSPGFYNLTIILEQDGQLKPVYKSADPKINSAVSAVPVRVTPTFVAAAQSQVDMETMGDQTVSSTALGLFNILPKDKYSNNVTNADQDGWSVVIATGTGTLFDFTKQEITPRFTLKSYPPDSILDTWQEANPSLLQISQYFELDYDIGLNAGLFQGMVTFRNAQIRGSPFSFTISPGPVGASDAPGTDIKKHPHRCTMGYNRCTYIEGLGLSQGIQWNPVDQ
eukprot:scaffold98883_cov45-Prasinocladus_malaysianus.AAC.1